MEIGSTKVIWYGFISPVVPRGQSRKLHCPMDWSLQNIVKCLSDVVYRIQDTRPKWKHSGIVVRFDRLKHTLPYTEPVAMGANQNPLPRYS